MRLSHRYVYGIADRARALGASLGSHRVVSIKVSQAILERVNRILQVYDRTSAIKYEAVGRNL